ncbi:MAG: SRPBCC family protein [bacterium]
MQKIIKQKVVLKATPQEVYEMLMDSKKHSAFTGEPAKISGKVGGKFTAYSGYAEGKNLELVEGKKIVQEWRASDWEEGAYSKVTFTLKKSKSGTELTFTQSGVPQDQYKSIGTGWKDFYWTKMKEYIANKAK